MSDLKEFSFALVIVAILFGLFGAPVIFPMMLVSIAAVILLFGALLDAIDKHADRREQRAERERQERQPRHDHPSE